MSSNWKGLLNQSGKFKSFIQTVQIISSCHVRSVCRFRLRFLAVRLGCRPREWVVDKCDLVIDFLLGFAIPALACLESQTQLSAVALQFGRFSLENSTEQAQLDWVSRAQVSHQARDVQHQSLTLLLAAFDLKLRSFCLALLFLPWLLA